MQRIREPKYFLGDSLIHPSRRLALREKKCGPERQVVEIGVPTSTSRTVTPPVIFAVLTLLCGKESRRGYCRFGRPVGGW